MRVQSWGFPYSRPEMAHRESPGWTSACCSALSAGGDDAAADVSAEPDPGVSSGRARGGGFGTSRSQPGSMRLGSVKVCPLSSVWPWLAFQMAVHSWGFPYSRPEIAREGVAGLDLHLLVRRRGG